MTDRGARVGWFVLKIMSYNLRRHAAVAELEELVLRHPVDALCLQEGEGTRMPEQIGELQLSAATYKSELGLAIYYRPDRFTALDSHAFTLRKALHDRVLLPGIERLLTTRLVDLQSGQDVQLASFHASPLSATNLLRRQQIAQAHVHLTELTGDVPTVMTGDFNYPLLRSRLIKQVEKAGFSLSLSDGPTYYYSKSIAYHFDFATSKGMDVQLVETLPKGLSDHRPILITAEILKRQNLHEQQAQDLQDAGHDPQDPVLGGVE
ncbi:endonuclease/exonuclease/phosphatase family protein [Subtercola boreus]|uniref:endonuclease/exonuclease/phosphatase family protein n=1 Tax=Subtercola boreus TaxID=120213 RepID=UPI00209C242D|nr:endonuclease/exonuclease/phosphatase family protein [Subtercola boreus]